MKSKILLLLFCGLLYNCTKPYSTYSELKYVESIIEEHPDSAMVLLSEMQPDQMDNTEMVVSYHLLLSMCKYKLYEPISNDSLINLCVDYYTASSDLHHLAIAYYYKGVIDYGLGKREEAVFCLKKAEELAIDVEDELLCNKIYEQLNYVNLNAQCYEFALYYAKKFLKSSLLLNDSNLIWRGYDDIGIIYMKMNQADSGQYYRRKCIQLLEERHMFEAGPYSNYADDLIDAGQYSEAKALLLKATAIKPAANQYIMLGSIALHEGDTMKAQQYLEQVLTFNDNRFSIKAYKELSKLCVEQGSFEKASSLLEKADSIKDAYYEQMKTARLNDLQQKYNSAIERQHAAQKLNYWLTALVIVTLLLGTVIILHLLRIKNFRSTLSRNLLAINEARQKILLLEKAGQKFSQEASQLQLQLEHLQADTMAQLGQGQKIFNDIKAKAWPLKLTATDEQCFIDYYAFTYTHRFNHIVSPYATLTRRLTTYLILCDVGLTDKDIAEALCISSSTIRSYRHRLKLK